jgi:PIN domain nuclease of toxin-antitoxin system
VAALIHLDTHAVAWLYADGAAALSRRAAAELDRAGEVLCSPMARVELQYLREIGRFRDSPAEVFDALAASIGLRICDAPFFAVTREAERQTWTRDPFDRVIVAQAILDGATLLTKDATIQAAYERAVW